MTMTGRLTLIGTAAAAFTGALLLRRLPSRNVSFQLISSDWKDWAKIGLGIIGLDRVNKALDLKLPPWLGAIQTVLVINPLMTGFNRAGARQLIVLAPMVAGIVQAADTFSKHAETFLQEKFNISPLITKLSISAGLMVVGIKAYPSLYGAAGRTGLMGNEAKKRFIEEAALKKQMKGDAAISKEGTGVAMITCARGCCTSAVCMSEIGEFFGAIGNWLKSQGKGKPS